MSATFTPSKLSMALLLGGIFSAANAADEAPKRIAAPEFVQAQMRGVLLPAQRNLTATSAALKQSVTEFCAAPQTANFAQVQANYVKTLAAWRAIEIAPIGPSSENDVGRVMESASAPATQILTLTKQMPAKAMVDGQAAQEAQSLPSWGIGFKAIESLLYSDKPAQSIKQLAPEKNCAYLGWQAQVVAYKADTLQRSWQGFSNGVGYDLSYPRQFQTEYLNRLVEGARELATTKIGLTSADAWQDQRSGATVIGLKANAAGLRALLLGNDGGIGLDDFIISRGLNAEWDKVAAQLTQLDAAIALTSDGLTPKTAQAIATAANGLADVLEKDVASKLELKIGKINKK